MATSDGGGKRKAEEGKEQKAVLYFWFNSAYASTCAALFKLKLTIDGDVIILPKQDHLKRVESFFKQAKENHMEYVSCAPFIVAGSSKYLLMPNEYDPVFQRQNQFANPITQTKQPIPSSFREKPSVYVFDTVLGKKYPTTLEQPPLAHKVDPIAVTVDNKVFVLSRRNVTQWTLPEPTFEVYDPEKDSWEALPQPWFNQHARPYLPSLETTQYWDSPGYAVFGRFIIVCCLNRVNTTKFLINSYNTVSKEWNPVNYPSAPIVVYRDNGNFVDEDDDPDDDDDGYQNADYLVWVGEAVVVKNFIYAYVKLFKSLVSYKCSANQNDTLSIDASMTMERCDLRQHWKSMVSRYDYLDISGAVGKIRDDMICVVKTMLYFSESCSVSQPVHLMIFRLHEQGGIKSILHSCDLTMPATVDFTLANIFSCFVLPPEVASKWEHRNKRRELSHELGTDASLVSDVEMKETTAIA